MKKTILSLILVLSIIAINAQEQKNDNALDYQKRNEIKLNALYMVLGAFEGTYEYILNEESGVGISLFLPYDDEAIDVISYFISPYYRFYFGNKFASGFFLEGFGMLNSIKEYNYDDSNKDTITDFALGIGLGGKWYTKRGLLGELNFGVGRNLFGASRNSDNDIIGKIGITIGYRF